jgi:hypothetical protein
LFRYETNPYSQPAIGGANAAAEPRDVCFWRQEDAMHCGDGEGVWVG